MEQFLQKDYLEGVPAERRRELVDAKNTLKEVIESIPREELKKMSGGLTYEFIENFGGDVNKYALSMMEGELSMNEPDIAAWHVIEKLNHIKEILEA